MSLLPSIEEIRLQADQIDEAIGLFGEDITLVSRIENSMYLDRVKFGEGTMIKGLLQSNPTKRVLDNLGWYKEFKESESTLVYIPYSINGNSVLVKERDCLLFKDRVALTITAVDRMYLYGLLVYIEVHTV